MPSFPKPAFSYKVDVDKELKTLKDYNKSNPDVKIPSPKKNTLVIATWNIANLGEQKREPGHLKIIAEIIKNFDLVAIQEVKENSDHFSEIVTLIGPAYKYVFSDKGGNNERMSFIYNSKKITVKEEVAELSISPKEIKDIKLPGVSEKFEGFDRSPYMVCFKAMNFMFTLLNVHLYFGDDSNSSSINRRCLEAYCVARWADLRSKSKYAFTRNVFAMGDFNLPKLDPSDKVYRALLAKGLELPEHSSKIYSNIDNDKAYDQIAFLPGLKSRILSHGIFPFDNAIFADLYKSKTAAQFRSYVRYAISDHRPMWLELDIKNEGNPAE